MLKVHYCGDPISDKGCESVYPMLVSMANDMAQEHHFDTTSENLYTRLRVGVCEGDMLCDSVVFEYDGLLLKLNEYGRIEEWPDGFCDYGIKLCERLLVHAMEKRKSKREQTNQ